MKQPAKILLLLVLNAFLLALVSFLTSYITLSNTLVSINSTLPVCIENALQASMESEEMFYYSNKKALTTENTNKTFNSNADNQNLVRYYVDGEWVQTDLYTLAYTIDKRELNKLPTASQLVNFNGTGEKALMTCYSWLFCQNPIEINDAESDESAIARLNANNVANNTLSQYYDFVGDALKIQTYVYSSDSEGNVSSMEWKGNCENGDSTNMISSIHQMGVQLGSEGYADNTNPTRLTNNSLSTVAKQGKVKIDRNSLNKNVDLSQGNYYMLSPYSLGYTYLDKRVVKPAIIANITNSMALQRVDTIAAGTRSGGIETSTGVIADSDEPMSLLASYADGGSVLTTRNARKLEINEGNQDTFNNGLFEVNTALDQVDLDIQYAVVNFYDSDNSTISELVNTIEGRVPKAQQEDDSDTTSKRMMEKDTKMFYKLEGGYFSVEDSVPENSALKGNRVVAKVTTTLDVNIPYKNSIMQWIRAFMVEHGMINIAATGENHYGVLALGNDGNAQLSTNSGGSSDRVHYSLAPDNNNIGDVLKSRNTTDSLEYRYVTYVAISR